MSNKVRKLKHAPRFLNVPDPPPEGTGTVFYLVEVPDTKAWCGVVEKAIGQIAYGRAYDEDTGNIKQALVIGRKILECMRCAKSIVTVNCGCGGSGSGIPGGSDPPALPGDFDGDPPFGYRPPGDGEIDNDNPSRQRACRVGDWILGTVQAALTQINELSFAGIGLDTLTNWFGVAWLTLAIQWVAGALSPLVAQFSLITFIINVAGRMQQLINALVDTSVNLDDLLTFIADNYDDLLCIILSGEGVVDILTNLNTFCDDNELGLGNKAVFLTMITADELNYLYWAGPVDIEERIQGLTCPGNSCFGAVYVVGNGNLEGEEVGVGTILTIDAVYDPVAGNYYAWVKSDPCQLFTMRLISFFNEDNIGDGRYYNCSYAYDYVNDLESLVGTTFQTVWLLAISSQPSLTMEVEIISLD